VSGFQIRQVRAYPTRQRRNPVSLHGPFETREIALQEAARRARASRRDEPSSCFYVEEVTQ